VTLAAAPWAIFRSGPGDGVYARSNVGGTVATTRLPGNWFGTPHRFRIDWTPTGVASSIDGASVPFEASGAGTSMRPIARDCSADGNTLKVDWLHVSPYRPSSIFLSRVISRSLGRAMPHKTPVVTAVGVSFAQRCDAEASGVRPKASARA